MTIKREAVGTALALVMLAGCTPNDTGLGDAAHANYLAQIVEPDPQYAENMTTSGDQVSGAQERYRKGSVKQPVAEATTSGISGGGSSGGN